MPPCIHKRATGCMRIIFMLAILYSLEIFTGRWPNAGLHVTVKNKSYCKTTYAGQFVTAHFVD